MAVLTRPIHIPECGGGGARTTQNDQVASFALFSFGLRTVK